MFKNVSVLFAFGQLDEGFFGSMIYNNWKASFACKMERIWPDKYTFGHIQTINCHYWLG